VTLYGFETVTRNADWYDNLTLFAKDAHRAPGNARLHYFLGQDLLGKAYLLPATGDGAARKALLTEGITELRKAVELYPEYPSALESLGVAHAYLDDAATARTYFEHALRLEPTFSVHYNFASLLFTLGDWDGAMKHYQFVVRRKPDWAEAHLGLGLALARSGEQSARTAVEERKRNSETGYRENTTAATRSFQEALSHLKRAVEIAPDDLKTWYAVGTLYQYLGDERNARYYLARAAQMKRRVNRPD